MRTTRLGKILLMAFALPFVFWACNDDDDQLEFEVYADAFVMKKVIDNEVKHGVSYFAYGNKGISSATVTPPAGEPFELVVSEESTFTFLKETSEEEFVSSLPQNGSYLFDVESKDGETVQVTEVVENGTLEIPVITETTYHSEDATMTVEWEESENADGFVVRLLDDEGKVKFLSYALNPTVDEFNINSSSGSWANQAYSGDELTLQLQAFTYESDVPQEELVYSIKEISVAENQVTWGQ